MSVPRFGETSRPFPLLESASWLSWGSFSDLSAYVAYRCMRLLLCLCVHELAENWMRGVFGTFVFPLCTLVLHLTLSGLRVHIPSPYHG